MLFDTIRELDRLESALLPTIASMAGQRLWDAAMDVRREEDRYVVELDFPGVDPASIDVSVDDGWLTVKAERSSSGDRAEKDWVVHERSHSAVVRRVAVSDAIDVDAITGTHENGVLTLTLPVSEKAKRHKVAISVVGGPATHELGAGTDPAGSAERGKVENAHSVDS